MSTLCVRPIRFTDRQAEHLRLYQALGATVLGDAEGPWIIVQFPSGRLALHAASTEHPAGTTSLGFETDDLADFAAAHQLRISSQPHGDSAVVTGPDGLIAMIDPAQPALPAAQPGLTVDPLWLTDQVEQAGTLLASLGGRRDLRSESGVWAEYCFDQGRVQAHHGEPVTVSLNFWHPGPLEQVQEQLATAGIDAALIDESYGRSLRIADPDLPDAEIWIGAQMYDTYGYHQG